uniref:Uncharacterized protein n=1 Tax=Physcomitrium patens TaxID=3218 RepID=A0A7I4CXL5_PHYPA
MTASTSRKVSTSMPDWRFVQTMQLRPA